MNQSKLMFTNKQNSYKIKRSQKGSFLLCLLTWEEGMEKEYIITVRNTYLVKADVDEDNSTPSKKNYNEYIEFKIANVLITIFFPIKWIIYGLIFLYKKYPVLFRYPIIVFNVLNNIINVVYPYTVISVYIGYGLAFFCGMVLVNQRISLLAGMVSMFLSIFLLNDSKWYDSRNAILFSFLFGGTLFCTTIYFSKFIALPEILSFLRLVNLGNTITYGCLYLTIIYLLILKIYKK